MMLDDTDKMVDNIREWSINKIANIEMLAVSLQFTKNLKSG